MYLHQTGNNDTNGQTHIYLRRTSKTSSQLKLNHSTIILPRVPAAGIGTYRWWRLVWLVGAACFATSLVCLVAWLQMAASGDVDGDIDCDVASAASLGARRTVTDAPAVADAAAVRGYRASPCTKARDSCYVTCRQTRAQLLGPSISQLLQAHQECASTMRLEVDNVVFANNTLGPDWLNVSASLTSLTLSDSRIDAFHDDAFSASQFAYLEELNLRGLPLRKLQSAALRPLRHVTRLSFENCSALMTVDPEVTAVLYNLTSLQVLRTVNTSNRHILPAFTRSINTDAIVDLRFNKLGTLRREDLGAAATSAASLYLEESGIEDVLVGTFPPSRHRRQLTLSKNNLTTLKNMSISFENLYTSSVIYLEKNPWNCDCSLLWLLPYVSTFADSPQCSTPSQFADWDLTSALEQLSVSCTLSSTTVPTTSTSETTQSSTIEPSEPSDTSESPTTEATTNTSDEFPDSTSELPETSPETSTPSSTSQDPNTTHSGTDPTVTTENTPTSAPTDEPPADLKPCYHVDLPEHNAVDDWSKDSVHIHDVDEFTLRVSVPYNLAGGFLVWTHKQTRDCYRTSPLSSPTVVLENLKPEVDYNICVLRPEETSTSIHNCHPHRTVAEPSKRTWLSNGDRTWVGPAAATVSLVILALSGLGTKLLLQRIPTLLFKKILDVGKTTVIDSRPDPPPRRLSLPNWWPPAGGSRRQSSRPSTSSGTYMTDEPPSPPLSSSSSPPPPPPPPPPSSSSSSPPPSPSPSSSVAQRLKDTVRKILRQRKTVNHSYIQLFSDRNSHSESFSSTRPSHCSTDVDSTTIFPL